MTSEKISITLPEQLAKTARSAAEQENVSLSMWLSWAVETAVRRQARKAAVAEFEAEHGALTPDELAEARAALASAEAQVLAALRRAS